MDSYVTGSTIKELRENQKLTQTELADKLGVTGKCVSKWETGRGYPDITLLEPLAEALNVSVTELISGEKITNLNKSSNMLRSKFYVCPICGNIVHSTGSLQMSCCGVSLVPLEYEESDEEHEIKMEAVEDEIYVTIDHPMTKAHYISFMAYLNGEKCEFIKLYPEGSCAGRFKPRGRGYIICYCNRHGLFKADWKGWNK